MEWDFSRYTDSQVETLVADALADVEREIRNYGECPFSTPTWQFLMAVRMERTVRS